MITGTCAICEREITKDGEKHHLKPKELYSDKNNPTVTLHPVCHRVIHLLFTNEELLSTYNTIGSLKQTKLIQEYLKWISVKSIRFLQNKRGIGKKSLPDSLRPHIFYRIITGIYKKTLHTLRKFKKKIKKRLIRFIREKV